MTSRLALFLSVLLWAGCQPCKDEDVAIPDTDRKFLFLSHPYVPYIFYNDIDTTVERLDYSAFDLTLLGGDLFTQTTLDTATLLWGDSIFDFRSENTLWAIGNHDYDQPDMVRQLLGHPLYYARYRYGITFLVLDTQDSLSNMVGDQLDLIRQVTDTIRYSSALVVMSHKLIWMPGEPVLEPMIDSVCNGGTGTCFWCTNPNNFYQDIYPRLVQVKSRGIPVICLAGDLGYKVQRFSYTTPEGIDYVANGMCSGCAPNEALVFSFCPATNRLSWVFTSLDSLPLR